MHFQTCVCLHAWTTTGSAARSASELPRLNSWADRSPLLSLITCGSLLLTNLEEHIKANMKKASTNTQARTHIYNVCMRKGGGGHSVIPRTRLSRNAVLSCLGHFFCLFSSSIWFSGDRFVMNAAREYSFRSQLTKCVSATLACSIQYRP